MKVSDFQKYLRALAEVVATKAPSTELLQAADALTPFAAYKMEEFGKFLLLTEEEYGTTGKLPKAAPLPPPPKPRAPNKQNLSLEQLLEAVDSLKIRLRTDHNLDRKAVEAELEPFGKLTAAVLAEALQRLGMKDLKGTKTVLMTKILSHTLSVQSGVERSEA